MPAHLLTPIPCPTPGRVWLVPALPTLWAASKSRADEGQVLAALRRECAAPNVRRPFRWERVDVGLRTYWAPCWDAPAACALSPRQAEQYCFGGLVPYPTALRG
jgi:hypothetical protein